MQHKIKGGIYYNLIPIKVPQSLIKGTESQKAFLSNITCMNMF